MEFAGRGAQYRYPIGYDAYLMYVAMWAQRFLAETGQGAEDLGAVAIAQREYARRQPAGVPAPPALRRQYLAAARSSSTPFRGRDCTIEVDGACAVLVTSLERARDLPASARRRRSPALPRRSAAGPRHRRPSALATTTPATTRRWLRDELFGRAGIAARRRAVRRDLRLLHEHRADGPGRARALRAGRIGGVRAVPARPRLDGGCPMNTHGGLLAEGYLHGMNTVAEAVLQVQGRGGARQVPRHDVCAVTSGALMDGSALVLTGDR